MPATHNAALTPAGDGRSIDNPSTWAAACRGKDTERLRPCVLLVEHRNEVYAALKEALEGVACDTACARSGADVLEEANHCDPSLIIINADMPDQGGWLITAKLRLSRHRQPVWLYVAPQVRWTCEWKVFAGVEKVLECDTDSGRLLRSLGQEIVRWLAAARPGSQNACHLGDREGTEEVVTNDSASLRAFVVAHNI